MDRWRFAALFLYQGQREDTPAKDVVAHIPAQTSGVAKPGTAGYADCGCRLRHSPIQCLRR